VCADRTDAGSWGIQALRDQLRNQKSMDAEESATVHQAIAGLLFTSGKIDEALPEWEEAYGIAQTLSSKKLVQSMEETLGVSYLHRALASPSPPTSRTPISTSALFPSHPGAVQVKPEDVKKAIDHLGKALENDTSNTEIQWLLNLAYMAAETYPKDVPKNYLIAPSVFASKEDLGRFPDVAAGAGVDVWGSAGGAIADDFDNDGLLDIVTSQVDDCAPLHFFHNNGDGTFTDRAAAAGLLDQMGGLNVIHADYNNDGCPDILVLRGGWEFPRRRSLLRNNCNGTFSDVTAQSGLQEPMRSSQSAVWVDFDNDGNLDLFIANENAPSQLFLNLGDGTFVDIAKEAGVDRTAMSKAVASADYDNDGYADLYVSNSNGKGFLYHNNGDRTFTEVSTKALVNASNFAFGAFFFDYDNDGWPDLFVTSYFSSVEEVARSYIGLPRKGDTLKLYKNNHDGTFRDVTAEVGLDRVFMPMGHNFGDIDNDGFLDFYLGMGNPSLAAIFPNVLFHNQEGKRFVDITTSSGTGAISKGHGTAFADFGNTGNEDIFTVLGGPSVGDRNTARLFENPGHDNDWITLRLVGEKSNRAAIGARIAVTVANAGGGQRTIYRTVGSGGSFGDSPFQQHIGLGKSANIEQIEIYWPASKTKQRFTNVKTNQFIEIKESGTGFVKLDRPAFRLGAAARK
ncbi:MAG: CRTAC1 family protein, partial [Bryobacteraceae bacterium]